MMVPVARKRVRRRRRPALLAQFPRLFWHPPVEMEWASDWSAVRLEELADYPALAEDLRVWVDELNPTYFSLDHRAQISQNQFWRRNVALIIGSLVATCLGAVQTARGGSIGWLAVTQAAFTALLAQLAVLIRLGKVRQTSNTNRLKAEWIKGEFYLFIARAGDYDADDRIAKLLHNVSDIRDAEGST